MRMQNLLICVAFAGLLPVPLLAATPAAAKSPATSVRLAAGADWIPVRDAMETLPGSALDFSDVVPNDAPAGKFGRVVARGAEFEFEKRPGVPQRFYGVNLCFDANYLSASESAALARRLAMTGYNAIRIHHYESILAPDPDHPDKFDPASLAALDGLVAACVSNGIYVTTDLFVSRKVSWRACGVDRPGCPAGDDYKQLVRVSPAAQSNLLAFARALLTHTNPHTGRRWADEPAIAWISLVNENNIGNRGTQFYRENPAAHAAWTNWLAARKADDPAAFGKVREGDIPGNAAKPGKNGTAFALFAADLETQFARRMKAFLRDELGCRALVTDLNGWKNCIANQLPRAAAYDYVDDHFYVDHPKFLKKSWCLPSRCANANPFLSESEGVPGIVYKRLLDRPFTITEYNYTAPGRFRGVGGILFGAQAALQDWGGIWRFAWSHTRKGVIKPVPLGYFNVASDPTALAAERAAICLYRRRDLAPLSRTCAIVLPPKDLTSGRTLLPPNSAPWSWLGWYARIGTVVADAAPAGTTWSFTGPGAYRKTAAEMRPLVAGLATGDGALAVDATNGTFRILTARTCGGFAERGTIQAAALSAELDGAAATVWASALDDRPLATSRRILLTHLTDTQNDGITYAEPALQTLLDWGRLPHIMRAGKARITLSHDAAKVHVFALDAAGARLREVPSTVGAGAIRFTADVAADPAAATYLYEIVCE